jgi:hypothetical protein
MPEPNRVEIEGYQALVNEVGKARILEAAYQYLQSLPSSIRERPWFLAFDFSVDLGREKAAERK